MGGQGDDRTIRNVVEAVYGTVVQVGEVHGDLHVHVAPDPTGVVVPLVALDKAAPELFVGREREIGDLLAALGPDRPTPEVVVVTAGMGGVGKTALVRRACAKAVQERWFPGGALMVDMRGYTPDGRPVPAPRVFGPLLRGLGVAQEMVPAADGEQAAVYHKILDTLAGAGKPVLLMLDNVSSSAQVQDLLPRHNIHRVVVTTRETLALQGARTLELDVFTAQEALAMLEQALLREDAGDTRVRRDTAAAARLVDLCGRLPLAVEITAALLAEDPDMTFGKLAEELEQAASKETVLRHGDRAVAATFDLSWRRLRNRDPPAARLLGLLTLDPGAGLSTDAAAALAGVEPVAIRASLRLLRHAHLLSLTDGHWRMHDLINAYVRDRVDATKPSDDRTAALKRLLDFYTSTADNAAASLATDESAGRFTDRQDAVAWFERERLALVGAIRLAETEKHHAQCDALAKVVAALLAWRHYVDDQVIVARHRVKAASALHDDDHGMALIGLGFALQAAGQFDEAVEPHREAVGLCSEKNGALAVYGLALRNSGRHNEAISVFQQLAAVDDRLTKGYGLSNLATVLTAVGRHEEALTARRKAIEIWRELGDKGELGRELNGLGMAMLSARRLVEGIQHLREAVRTSAEAGNLEWEAAARDNLAKFTAVTDFRSGLAEARAAVSRFQAAGEPRLAREAQVNVGRVLARGGNLIAAIQAYRQAVEMSRAADDKSGEGESLIELSDALSLAGFRDEATAEREKAVEIFRELGDPFRGGLAGEPPRTEAAMETGWYSYHSRGGCGLLWLLLVGVGIYFLVTEVSGSGWWWVLGGFVGVLILRSAGRSASRAMAEVVARTVQEQMNQPPQAAARILGRGPSARVSARSGCLPALLGTGLAWYFADQEWGTEAGVAVGLATFVVLVSFQLRLMGARIRRSNPPPD